MLKEKLRVKELAALLFKSCVIKVSCDIKKAP